MSDDDRLALDALNGWLAGEGRAIADRARFVEALAERLLAAGVPLDRLTTGVPLLHPQVFSSSCQWTRGEVATERLFHEQPEGSTSFLNSPIRRAYQGAGVIARRLDGEGPFDFPVLDDLKRDGYVEYRVMSVPFSDGSFKAVTAATRHPAGFGDRDRLLLDGMLPTLAMVLEIQSWQRTARTLLDTYLGRQTGQRVLGGQIRRGDGDDVHAVIWFCDLRGSTPLADALGRQAFLAVLNDFLACMTDAVHGHDGEVLRFIGDAALAIFPIDADNDASTACASAVAAARDGMRRVAALNAERASAGLPTVDYGIGLHLGDVVYGNIGAPDRLEFTVIGAAANEAARIEAMTRTLGTPLVVSGAVAGLLDEPWVSLGEHELRGVATPQPLFTLREAAPSGD